MQGSRRQAQDTHSSALTVVNVPTFQLQIQGLLFYGPKIMLSPRGRYLELAVQQAELLTSMDLGHHTNVNLPCGWSVDVGACAVVKQCHTQCTHVINPGGGASPAGLYDSITDFSDQDPAKPLLSDDKKSVQEINLKRDRDH